MTRGGPLIAGAAYFAGVFAVAFALGVLRMMVIAPRLGAVLAVLLEAPVVLGVSWGVCRWCVGRFRVPPTVSARLTMGVFAFAILMAAEGALGLLAFGRSVADQLSAFRTLAGGIGLAAQIGFGIIPLVGAAWRRR